MRAPNHIAGGIVFSGLFSSLWNINIFSSVDMIVWTTFAALLPDIDHTQSTLGKMFYPLAKFLDRRFGHRTITHSLIFLLIISLLSTSIERIFSENYHYSTILFFAVFSHLILDMFTIQGIPLFYPFARNPCVIPGNPSMRMRSGNARSEIAVFCILILLMISLTNLFKNGFWTTYNRAFGTLQHVDRENTATDKLIQVEYDFIKNSKEFTGTAYLLASSTKSAILFDSIVFTLSSDDNSIKIKSVKPLKTNTDKRINEISFFNVGLDSLQNLIKNKIISGQIQSSIPVEFIEKNITKTSTLFKLDYSYNSSFNLFEDTSRIEQRNKIAMLKIKIKEQNQEYYKKLSVVSNLKAELNELSMKLNNSNDLYVKNDLQKKIISLKSSITNKENSFESFSPDELSLYQISVLESQLGKNSLLFSGIISYPVLPESSLLSSIIK